MSRVSEPLFYDPSRAPYESYVPKHRGERHRCFTDCTICEPPVNYKPQHRNTPSWEATPISDALRDFIGGA